MSNDAKYLTIREWSVDDRPREKMMLKGSASLSDAELLAILIGSGVKNESAVDLAKRIMRECKHDLNELARFSLPELQKKFRGIGVARAVTIAAALELGKRRNTKEVLKRKKIQSSKDLCALVEPMLMDLIHEEFWIIFLDAGNHVIDVRRLTQGGLQATIVDIPLLLKMALEKSCVCIAVAHNHPSGQNHPSREDEKVTVKIRSGCEAIGIRLLDHIIIARGQYYSFCDEGKL